MSSARRLPFALTAIVLFLSAKFCVHAKTFQGKIPVEEDLLPECGEWAERGDCKLGGRPHFMHNNCAESCHKKTYRDPEHRRISDDDQEEFYELSVKEATGKVLPLENFEGYITVLVNAARVCEYSDIFYETLEHMHSVHPYALEILAFPFDHPNIDIESCRDKIHSDENKGGRKIHIMEAIDINGPDTHPVYKYLKKLFDIEELDLDEAYYFFINPDVTMIEHYYGYSDSMFKNVVHAYMKGLDGEL